jgi:hypothetical protein
MTVVDEKHTQFLKCDKDRWVGLWINFKDKKAPVALEATGALVKT